MSDQTFHTLRRTNGPLTLLALALLGTPIVWGLRLVINYGIDSYFCFPGERRSDLLPSWAWPTLLGLDLFSFFVAAVAAVFAFVSWRRTRDDIAAAGPRLLAAAEERTRFLSLWAFMIGVGFMVAIGFDLVGLWITPSCG